MNNDVYRILVVDDDSDTRAALCRSLRAPGYVIRECRDGLEAIEFVKHNHIDAILTDFDMPGLNGLDLLTQIRIRVPGAVRMLVTARVDVSLAVRAINEGSAHRYILKPWDNVDVRGMLHMALHGRAMTRVGG